MSPFHTTKKNGRRYRDCVPQRENKEHAGAFGLPRLPAAELESAVLDQLRAVLRSPPDIVERLLAGRQPRRLTLIWFQRNPIPVDWQEQRRVIASFE